MSSVRPRTASGETKWDARALRLLLSEDHREWLSEDDLQGVFDCFQSISSSRRDASTPFGSGNQSAFITHLKSIIQGYETQFAELQDVSWKYMKSLQLKQDIYDLCFAESISSVNQISPSLGGSLMILRRVYSDIFSSTQSIFQDVCTQNDNKLKEFQSALHSAEAESASLIGMIKEVEMLMTTTNQKETIKEKKKAGNKVVPEKSGIKAPQIHFSPQLDPSKQAPQPRSQTPPRGYSALDGQHEPSNTLASKADVAPRQRTSKQQPSQLAKDISLKQLKELIEDIYSSKERHDIKCRDSDLSLETMLQHVNDYLNQKYGIRTLVSDWAQAIQASIIKYRDEDNDVVVFDKILNGVIDEDFRYVQKKLKDAVKELIKMAIKSKYPSRTEADLTELLERRVSGTLAEEECFEITQYLYDESDTAVIWRTCQAQIDDIQSKGAARRMPFDSFMKILLDYQLQMRERFLGPFLQHYRQYDAGSEGVVSEQVFRVMVKRMFPDKADKEVTDLLRSINTGHSRQITMTQCVRALAQDLEKLALRSLSRESRGNSPAPRQRTQA